MPIFGQAGFKLASIFFLIVISLYGCNDSGSGSGDNKAKPSAPSALSASPVSPYSIKLDWQIASGGSGAIEYRVIKNGSPVATVSDVTWTDTLASPSTQYCYNVLAVDQSGKESGPTDEVCTTTPPDETIDMPPTVPSDLSLVPASSSGMTLSWGASHDDKGVAAYRIYKNGVQAASVETTSWSDTGLVASTNYCYSVSAVDAAGNESQKTADVCTKTPDPPAPPVDNTPPAKPAALNAVPSSSSSLQLTWTPGGPASDVKEYRIYKNGQKIASTQAAAWTDSGLTPATNYCYTVTAADAADNESVKSDQACATTKPDTEPPPVPSQLKSSSKTMDSITIEWSGTARNINGKFIYRSGFKIYRDGIFRAFVTGNSYTDTGLLPGKRYCYTITSVDEYGNESAASGEFCVETSPDSAAPSKPLNLMAYTLSSYQIKLVWGGSTDNSGSVKYRIYRFGMKIAEVNGTSFTDSGLSESSYYCYRVSALDGAGNESERSGESCEKTDSSYTPPPPPPADTVAPTAPSNVAATPESSTSVKLTWSASTDNVGVTGYKIYRAGVLKATVTDLFWTETGLTAATAYCYKISAIDAAGNESAKSDEKCATTFEKLNDTGINWWSDNSDNNLSGPLAGFPGQDADHDRDKDFDDNSDGHAGFSFTKIDSSGNVLPVVAANWSAVLDNVTGLMWENKTAAAGPHCVKNKYFWYEPDNTKNGGDKGQSGLSTYEHVQNVNAEDFCGHNDWRMPTKEELRSIVNYGAFDPAIDTNFFPDTANASYWSSSPLATHDKEAWVVSFAAGQADFDFKTKQIYARLVRGGQ